MKPYYNLLQFLLILLNTDESHIRETRSPRAANDMFVLVEVKNVQVIESIQRVRTVLEQKDARFRETFTDDFFHIKFDYFRVGSKSLTGAARALKAAATELSKRHSSTSVQFDAVRDGVDELVYLSPTKTSANGLNAMRSVIREQFEAHGLSPRSDAPSFPLLVVADLGRSASGSELQKQVSSVDFGNIDLNGSEIVTAIRLCSIHPFFSTTLCIYEGKIDAA